MTLPLPIAESLMDHRLGLDIGGANIKLFHTAGHAISVPFAMWLRPKSLAETLVSMIRDLPRCQSWGVTMTGEMADVFYDRGQGVRSIVEQTMFAARQLDVSEAGFYAIPGRLMNASQAFANPDSVASANWHALARWVASWIDRPSLLIDIGTTTTDLIPIAKGCVDTESQTDFDRLQRGELVYVGIRRTPVCSLITALPLDGELIPIVREVFATTDDCSLLLRWTAEDIADTDTCDQQPRTRTAAANRLARMIGLDHRAVTVEQTESMASFVMNAVKSNISIAAEGHGEYAKSQWILSGHAKQLIDIPAQVITIDLAAKLSKDISRIAPAYAICELMKSGDLQ